MTPGSPPMKRHHGAQAGRMTGRVLLVLTVLAAGSLGGCQRNTAGWFMTHRSAPTLDMSLAVNAGSVPDARHLLIHGRGEAIVQVRGETSEHQTPGATVFMAQRSQTFNGCDSGMGRIRVTLQASLQGRERSNGKSYYLEIMDPAKVVLAASIVCDDGSTLPAVRYIWLLPRGTEARTFVVDGREYVASIHIQGEPTYSLRRAVDGWMKRLPQAWSGPSADSAVSGSSRH